MALITEEKSESRNAKTIHQCECQKIEVLTEGAIYFIN